ncbi:MAG TPA: hypothetical protein VGT44_14595 [Ktedonobacteraceae bacterium]|nr:hypothetical protein [Ktedonobacteraceae bacterium]
MSFARLSSPGVDLNSHTTTILRFLIWRKKQGAYAGLAVFLPLLLMLLVSCSNPFGGSNGGGLDQASPAPGTTAPAQALTSLNWCDKPSMLFRDEGARPSPTATATSATTATPTVSATTPGASPTITVTPTVGSGTPTTITSWQDVKSGLGFTVYLPTALPGGTCLVSAQATIHDPTLGGNFLIGYLLPDHTSLTISEAPLISQNTTFQCNASASNSTQKSSAGSGTPTPLPVQLCSGTKDTTNIVLSAQRSVVYLQQLFTALQPNIAWIPAS